MKLGTENRNQLIALAVLGTIGVGMLAYELWPASSSPSPTAAQTAASPSKPAMHRTASGKMVPVIEPRLDEGVLEGRDAHELMDEARQEAARPA